MPDTTESPSGPGEAGHEACRPTLAIDDMTDAQFDALLPAAVRQASSVFWTPVAVARRAADVLEMYGASHVLDVGSGPGKFCVVAAARAPRVDFVGIEHRPPLVAVARSLAADTATRNASFRVGDATRQHWPDFDAFYVFNSFAENAFPRRERFDHAVELSRARRVVEVLRVARWLMILPPGTLLLTYHGLGGPIPESYECVGAETIHTGNLRLWRKGDTTVGENYWLEEGAQISVMTERQVGARSDPAGDLELARARILLTERDRES